MADRIGIEIAPDVLEMLLRVGATITGNHGFKARLVENGVPEDFDLVEHGYNREKGQFFFIFAPKAGPAGPINWQAPVYEREKEVGDANDP
jgi:hypothetical protein